MWKRSKYEYCHRFQEAREPRVHAGGSLPAGKAGSLYPVGPVAPHARGIYTLDLMSDTSNANHPPSDDSRYRQLIEAVTDYAIYMLDANGFVTSWNPGAQRFKGYTAGEILGRHFSQFYAEEDRLAGKPARALATAAREGKFEG